MADETQAEAETEVVLTPFLQQVKRRAEARGIEVEAHLGSDQRPWLRVTITNSLVISIWTRESYILTAGIQNRAARTLIPDAQRVVDLFEELLEEDPF